MSGRAAPDAARVADHLVEAPPAVTTAAARIRRDTRSQRRFLARAAVHTQALLDFAALADPAQRRAQLSARLGALRTALLASPHWCATLRARSLAPNDLATLDDLRHFPTLDRAALAGGWHDLIALPAAARDQDEIVAVRSSGTTGDPVLVPKDRYDCLHMWSVLRFWTVRLGIALPPRPRVALLCALPGALEYSVRLPLFHDGALHRISLQRPRAGERLRRAQPTVVFSDPEGLHWLAAQSDVPPPALLLSSATHLPAALRARLPAPVVNYYATTETGPIAWECLVHGGRFHVLLPDVWVESESGVLLVTRLRPSVLPLLRYRTGDVGVVSDGDCDCGHHGRTITGFSGRSACAFRLPGGASVDAWRLAVVLKHQPLRSFRLTQRGPSDFLLELVATDDPACLRAPLAAALRALGWPAPQLELRGVDTLPEAAKAVPFHCTWTGSVE